MNYQLSINYFKISSKFIFKRFPPVIFTQSNRQFLNEKKSLEQEFDEKKYNKISERDRMKLRVEQFKSDFKWALERFKNYTIRAFNSDNTFVHFDDNQLIKIWDFDQRNNDKLSSYYVEYKLDKMNDMNNWTCTCDSDYDLGKLKKLINQFIY